MEKKKIKIGYVIPRFFPFKGGAEENFHALSTRAYLKGFDVSVVTTDVKFRTEKLEKNEVIDGVKVFRNHAINTSLYSGFYPEFLPFILRTQFDIIHTSGVGFFWREFCLILKKLFSNKTKFICTPHGPFMSLNDSTGIRKYIRILGTLILRLYLNWLYDYFIEVTPKQKDWMFEKYRINESKIVLVPNGINEDYIEKEVIEHLKNEKVVITYMNRMEWYKGIQDVLKAIQDIISSKISTPPFVFYIMGKAGNYTEKLKDIVSKNDLDEYVKFIFHPSDEERDRIFYKESQINILPSKWEATGITLIEAMAKGNIIITTTGNEACDIIIKEGENGFIYDFGDTEKLQNILTDLLKNHQKREIMRKKSLNYSKEFTWEKVVPQYFDLLKKLSE